MRAAPQEGNIKTTKPKTIFELEIVIVHIVNRYHIYSVFILQCAKCYKCDLSFCLS